MVFADPRVCPDCRGPIDGSPVCATCGLDLRDPQVRELWQTLLHADSLLTAATERRDAARTATPQSPPQSPVQPPPQPPLHPPLRASAPGPSTTDLPPVPRATPTAPLQPPPLGPTPERERSWSVGTVLLGLGAIGLVVAALIFVSRSWDSIGLIGKAAVLAVVTAAVTTAAVWATRRPLRSSAEALWAVALVLLAVDLLGARGEGLFGLDAVPWPWAVAVTGTLIAVTGAAVVRGSRPWVDVDLITASVLATAGIALAGSGAATIGDLRDFWHVFVGLIVSGVLGLALRISGSAVIAWGARAVVAVWFAIAAALAVQEAAEQPSLDALVTDGRGAPLLLMSLAALVVAATVPLARVAMTATGVVGLGLLVTLPSADAWAPEGGWIALALLVAAVAWLGNLGTTAWVLGLRWGAGFGGLFVAGLAAWWLADVLHVIGTAFDRFGDLGSTTRVGTWVGEHDPIATIVIALALVVAVRAALRWLEEPTVRAQVGVTSAAVVVGVLGSVLAFDPPTWALALALTVSTVVLVAVAVRRREAPDVFWVAAATAALALGVSVAAEPVMAVTWIVLALGAAAVVAGPEALLVPVTPLRRGVAALVGSLFAGGLAVAVAASNGLHATSTLVAVVGAALVLAAATRASGVVRPYLEGGAALALAASAVSPDSSLIASIGFTIIGVTACAIAAATVDRRWYVWPGIAALVVAYVLLIVDSGFGFVEAYTVPLAAIALGGGVVLLRRTPSMSSWVALGPGLVLALLPSLPQALADPTGLRALLLGLAAVVILSVGARLGRQAPFLLGVGVAALVLVFNIGPYANAAPRVVIISIVSAVLLALGITWEDRVRDGRKVMAFVKEMR